jgi:hypothetical protein
MIKILLLDIPFYFKWQQSSLIILKKNKRTKYLRDKIIKKLYFKVKVVILLYKKKDDKYN